MTGLIKWGAFAVELCLLSVLLGCVATCSCPLSTEYIREILLLVIGAGAFAYLSSSLYQGSRSLKPIKTGHLLLEPPVAIWLFSILLLLTQVTNHGSLMGNHEYILYKTK
jgi:hypothetical protein